MGRHQKIIFEATGLDRRETGYYSTPSFIVKYITDRLLNICPSGKVVLDPCVGRGEFVTHFYHVGKHVIGFDIVDFAPSYVHEFKNEDFLRFYMDNYSTSLFRHDPFPADYIVANPPYNCHETDYIRTHKKELILSFGKSAVLNMYSMFVKAIIDIAKPGCVIGIITLDSFLTAHGHENLRSLIRECCTIHNLHLCPTDLFLSQGADVRTCILILEKGRKPNIPALTSNRPSSTKEFIDILDSKQFIKVPQDELSLHSSFDRGEFIIGVPAEIRHLFNASRLGALFPCITGISTGNDQKYLSRMKTDYFSVPFFKNPGSRRFHTEPDAYLPKDFLSIEKSVPNFMVRNKQYLFRGGISCSSMGVAFTASFLPDNATVGVNANIIVNCEARWWLMAYLNSSLVTYIVRGILIRSNMVTAGYVSRIPVPDMRDETKKSLATLAKNAYERKVTHHEAAIVVKAIDKLVFDELSISDNSRKLIDEFVADLVRRT